MAGPAMSGLAALLHRPHCLAMTERRHGEHSFRDCDLKALYEQEAARLEALGVRAASPEPREDAHDHIAWAQHVRAEHEATHGEAEQCGAECIVLGLTEFEDATPATGPDERAALERVVEPREDAP